MTNQTDSASADDTSAKVDQFILGYLPLVQPIAIKICARLSVRPSLDALLSAGIRGVVAAARKHEHKRSIPARTYAVHRITGAILEELATSDGMSGDLYRLQRSLKAAAASAPSRQPA